MWKTPIELRKDVGRAIRARRLGYGWSQAEAAKRAGLGLSTWRRMESDGPALFENLIDAAVILRCEEGIGQLFPPPVATTLDDLLRRQAAATGETRQRAPRRSPRS